MADSLTGVAELLKVSDANLSEIDVTDLLQEVPFLRSIDADTASHGTDHKYIKETGAPTVGFRAENAGRFHSKSADTLVSISLKIFDASFTCDKAIADAYPKGGAAAWLAREARRHLRAGFVGAEKQLLYGTGQDAGGFTGLVQAATINHADDAMVYNAGGTAAGSGPSGLTSVYFVRSVSDHSGLTLIMGNDGNLEIGDTITQFAVDGDGKRFPAYMTPISAWMALQLGSIYDIGRICNLSEEEDHTLTDDMIFEALAKFPSAKMPTHILMNRRSLKQLRASRTATNATGAPAPIPTEAAGIPILSLDHITNSETALANA